MMEDEGGMIDAKINALKKLIKDLMLMSPKKPDGEGDKPDLSMKSVEVEGEPVEMELEAEEPSASEIASRSEELPAEMLTAEPEKEDDEDISNYKRG